MDATILKILRPSILGYLPEFLLPFFILFLPFPGFKTLIYSIFWILELLLCFNALATIFSSKYKIGTTHIETVTFSRTTFGLDTVAINYSNIQEINIHQTFIQNIFKIGDLTVDTAGKGSCKLKGIENPDSIMKFILDLKEGTN